MACMRGRVTDSSLRERDALGLLSNSELAEFVSHELSAFHFGRQSSSSSTLIFDIFSKMCSPYA